jgi:hypothetical protein
LCISIATFDKKFLGLTSTQISAKCMMLMIKDKKRVEKVIGKNLEKEEKVVVVEEEKSKENEGTDSDSDNSDSSISSEKY